MDRDTFTKDDFIGQTIIGLNSLKPNELTTSWYQLSAAVSGNLKLKVRA